MGAEEQQNELTDVALCYQSMGIQLDASPAEIEQMYRSLTEEYKKKQASQDPALREEARLNLELIGEMYEKIRGSITYHAMQKEYLKKNDHSDEARYKRPVHQAVAEKNLKMNCPRCNGLIPKGLKTCPVCKSPLYTATQKIMRAYFTPKMVILYCIVLSVVAAVVVGLLHPERFSGKKTEVDFSEQKEK
jgi:hypothetical protein